VTFTAVVHNPSWLGLAADADTVVEGRMLSESWSNLKSVSGDVNCVLFK
jgi:hypothetical protein